MFCGQSQTTAIFYVPVFLALPM